MILATILYEDQLAVEARYFGLHELVLQCLADRFPLRLDELRALFQASPRKGNTNVRKECDDPKKRKLYRSRILVAVYDSDKIRDFVRSGANCKSSLRSALRGTCPWGDQLTTVFLERNTETVLKAIVDANERGNLFDKPEPDLRDKILQSAAWGPKTIRDHVLAEVPSFQYLVEKLAVEVTRYLS